MITTMRPAAVPLCRRDQLAEPCRSCPIRDLGLCAALEDGELIGPQRSVRHVSFEPGHSILTEGEPADHVFIVVSGAAALQKSMADGRRQITAVLLAGDVIGMTGEGGPS